MDGKTITVSLPVIGAVIISSPNWIVKSPLVMLRLSSPLTFTLIVTLP